MKPTLLSRQRATERLRDAEAAIRALGVKRLALFGSVVRDEPRDYLRHTLLEADYLLGQRRILPSTTS